MKPRQPRDIQVWTQADGMPDLLAEREGLPLRGAEGGCAAARLEQGPKAHTALGQKSKMGPHGPHFLSFLRHR
jgi:hypothetical protein